MKVIIQAALIKQPYQKILNVNKNFSYNYKSEKELVGGIELERIALSKVFISFFLKKNRTNTIHFLQIKYMHSGDVSSRGNRAHRLVIQSSSP